MVLVDMYSQPTGKEYSIVRATRENMYDETSWKEAQKIIDDYKKKQLERMKPITPMKPMMPMKSKNLDDKVKEK